MSGLLERGNAYVKRLKEIDGESLEDFQLTGTSGISKEDQAEILSEIEKVAAQNRITVTPELFTYRASKRGSAFPLVVNIAAIVSLAAGLGLMAYFFRQSETRITQKNTSITTAEGAILQEVKRETTQQLQQKDAEIATIQTKLKDIDSQRASLQTNMDTQVAQREAVLKKQMQDELDAERAKLQAQGVSATEITSRLQALEQQKTAEFNQQLDAFRQQAEAERTKLASSLQNLQQQYQSDLQQATADRQQIQAAAQQRESQLRTQYEGKLSQSEAQLSSAQQQLTSAQQQLQQLQNNAQQATLAESQITGFYNSVRQQVTTGDYQSATKTLAALRQFLSTDSVMAIDAIRARRPADLFIIDSLTDLMGRETAQSRQDTQSLIAAASLVSEARSLAAQAQQQLTQGDSAGAQATYSKAIALIPGISAAHTYFVDLDKARLDEVQKQLTSLQAERDALAKTNASLSTQLLSEGSANQQTVARLQSQVANRQATDSRLLAALAQARDAYAKADYAQSLTRYQEALALVPGIDSTDPQTIMNQIGASTVSLQDAQLVKAATQAAAPIMASASSLIQQGKYSDALDQYNSILTSYPKATQVPDAIAGIRKAFDANTTSLQAQITQLTQQRDQLKTQVATLQGNLNNSQSNQQSSLDQANSKISDLTSQNQALTTQVASLQKQIQSIDAERSSLQARLSDAQSQLQTAQQTAQSANTRSATNSSAATAQTDAATQAELTRLRAIESKYSALQTAYQHYASGEDSLFGTTSPTQTALLKGKLLLDDFLASSDMRTIFPGLLDRIKRYDQGFESSGRNSAISDLSDTVYNLSQMPNAAARSAFLSQQISSSTDTVSKEFLQDLKTLVTAAQ